MTDKVEFPVFLFHISKIADREAKEGTVEIPVLRLWISKEDFYDLNVDNIFTALDNENGEEQKSSMVEIFNNHSARSMVFNCDFKNNNCEYFISTENTQMKSLDDVEKRGVIAIDSLKASLTDFIISYAKWADKKLGNDVAEK